MAFLDRFRKKEEKKTLEKMAEKTAAKVLASKKSPLRPSSAQGSGRAQQGFAGQAKNIKKSKSQEIGKVSIGKQEDKKTSKKIIKSKFKGGYGVLIKPLITEKISEAASLGKYAFAVSRDANKPTIKKAVNAVYGVNVKSVRIINVIGKNVRYGRSFGKRKDWKKAIITLAPGEKIEIYEGV